MRADVFTPTPWRPARRGYARYVLSGCSGAGRTRREHVFEVVDHECRPPQSKGWMTVRKAVATFGLSELFMSASHGICPSCADKLDHPSAQDVADAIRYENGPNTPIRLALVSYIGAARSVRSMREAFPGLVDVLDHLRRLTRAGYVTRSREASEFTYASTSRGRAAVRRMNARRISAARRTFRGKKEM